MTRSDLSSTQASRRQQRPQLTAVPLKVLPLVVGIPLMVMGVTYLLVRQGAEDLSRDTAQRLREEGNLINRRIQERVEALSAQNRQLATDPRVIAAVTSVAEGAEAPPVSGPDLETSLAGDFDLVALMAAQSQQRVIGDPLLDSNDELGRALGQVLLDTERQGLTWVGDDWLLYAAAPVRSPDQSQDQFQDQGVLGGLLIGQRLNDAQANAFNFDRADLILTLHSPTGAVAAQSQPLDPGRLDLDPWRRAASGQAIIENGILFRPFRLGMSEGLVFSLLDPTLAPRQQAIAQRALIYASGLGLLSLLVSLLIARLWANQAHPDRAGGDPEQLPSADPPPSGQTTIRLAKMSATGQDEVGRLFHSFEIMAQQLQITLETLEDKVAERTAQLASARLQAEEARSAAESANQSKSQFLANMSHELRTPMNAIIGYTEILMEEAEEEDLDSFVPDLKKIHAAAKHLLALINDVLDLSKIEAGKMDLYLETFELDPLVEEVISTIQPLADKNSNRLVIKRSQALGSIHGDMTKLRQNLFNLLSNACKFTHEGEVTLEIARRQNQGREWIFFRIRDSGIGMTPEQMGRLFQAFSQADQATTRKYGGTGLGLVITRRFCQMMGGDIKVESEPGQGSTFTFWIPAQIEAAVKEHTLKDKAAQADGKTLEKSIGSASRRTGSSAHPLVLVIDDDATVCDLIERALQKQGYRVAIAHSGSEGIEMARRLHPAVITLDVMMPQMDGWTVLSTLKADPEVAEIPVVMVTIVDEKNLGFALGATEYLTKPFDRERLVEVIGRYCPAQRVPTALIIDDDPSNRNLLRRVLEKEGWQVQEAANGRPALHILENFQPDLILLDLMMPEMDGFEFAVRLRQNIQWRDIPVVVLTAKTLTPEDRQRLKGSVEAILGKSALSQEALIAEIQQLVQTRAVAVNR